jgi:hypothetical protein
MKEFSVRLTWDDGVLKATLDGKRLGAIRGMSLFADPSGNLSVRVKLPPRSPTDGPTTALLEETLSSLSDMPWLEVERGSGPVAAMSPILSYMEGSGRDHSGMTMDQVLGKDFSWYERSHDFVQWLLPTRRRSRYEPGAPVLTDEDVMAFTVRSDLQKRYLVGVSRMEEFLGLDRIRFGRPPVWVRGMDHNHKRISRLLESLRDLGLQDRADQVFASVMAIVGDHPGVVNAESVSFWRRAAGAVA